MSVSGVVQRREINLMNMSDDENDQNAGNISWNLGNIPVVKAVVADDEQRKSWSMLPISDPPG